MLLLLFLNFFVFTGIYARQSSETHSHFLCKHSRSAAKSSIRVRSWIMFFANLSVHIFSEKFVSRTDVIRRAVHAQHLSKLIITMSLEDAQTKNESDQDMIAIQTTNRSFPSRMFHLFTFNVICWLIASVQSGKEHIRGACHDPLHFGNTPCDKKWSIRVRHV